MKLKIIPLSLIVAGRPVVFLMHDLTGSVAVYRDFAKKIEGYNVYGINQFDCDGKKEPWNVQQLGRFYADEILKQHPLDESNRYNFIGFSLGGILAMEVAHGLKEKRGRLGFIALIDTPPLSFLNRLLIDKYVALLDDLAKNIFNLDSWKPNSFTDNLEGRISLTDHFLSQCRIAVADEDLKKKNQKCALLSKIANNLLMELISNSSDYSTINSKKVFVFSTKKTASDFQLSEDLGWREFLGDKFDHENAVSVLPSSCRHFDIFLNEQFFSPINIFLQEQLVKIKFTESANLMLKNVGLLSEEERLRLLGKFFRKAEKLVEHTNNRPHSLWSSHSKTRMVDSTISPSTKIYGNSV